jgi:hypothetical protein
MACSPAVHAKSRNLISTTIVDAENTQETSRVIVECTGSQRTKGRCAMTKLPRTLTALAAAATLGLAAIAAPQPAEARGGAIAAGVIGGLAAGAIIGSAINGPYYGYGPGYYYGGPSPVYYGGCYWTRQRVWDGWGWRFQRVRVCG